MKKRFSPVRFNHFRFGLAVVTAALLFSSFASESIAQFDPQYSINQGGNPTAIIFSNQTGLPRISIDHFGGFNLEMVQLQLTGTMI